MILRDYQHQTHDAVFKEWETVQSTLAVLPTGAGKTVVFAHIIKSLQPARVMVLAHRDELITQARDKIERVTGLTVEIEKADQYASNNLFNKAPIVVSSIQTQISGPVGKRRYLRFNPHEFGALILDEAHHALSPSWREAIGYYCKNPNLKVLGCTATPDRADKLGLKAVFQSVAFNYGILDAMLDGWLVEIGQQFVPVKGLDFSHIRTTAGDLNEGDLAKLMEMEQNIQGICQPSIEAMWGLAPKTLSGIPTQDWKTYLETTGKTPRRSIVFTVSVEQARICSEVFSRTMNGVEWICGETRKEDRIQTLKRFASGDTHCVCNCGILLEGFDNPAVELIVMARPTKSRSLYAQCCGRSLRPLPGVVDGLATKELRRTAIQDSAKPIARILDFVGNAGKHKLITSCDILGGRVSEEAVEAAKSKTLEDGTVKRILKTLSDVESELQRKKQQAIEEAAKCEAARKARLLARVDYSLRNVDPFGGPVTRIASSISRDGHPFSEKQARLLQRNGYDPKTLRYGAGKAIIGKLFEKNGWNKKTAQSARLATIGKEPF